MRERDKIVERFAAAEFHGVLDSVAFELMLEVLLDIRDLLQSLQPPTIITTGGDADGRDQGLRREDDQHS